MKTLWDCVTRESKLSPPRKQKFYGKNVPNWVKDVHNSIVKILIICKRSWARHHEKLWKEKDVYF